MLMQQLGLPYAYLCVELLQHTAGSPLRIYAVLRRLSPVLRCMMSWHKCQWAWQWRTLMATSIMVHPSKILARTSPRQIQHMLHPAAIRWTATQSCDGILWAKASTAR